MDKYNRRRSIAILAAVAVLVVAGAAALMTPHLGEWLSTRSRPDAHALQEPVAHARSSAPVEATESSSASVQLVTQDLTPSSQLVVTASGFRGGEQLVVKIEDIQGNPYGQETLIASASGSLIKTPLEPPQQLASGAYQLIVVGSESHRTASITFRMDDTPPTVTLDTYTGKPGQVVGFAGNGFIAGELVRVYLGPSRSPLVSVRATDGGAVNGQLPIPALSPGTYTLTMVGANSQAPASVGFSIQGFAPWVVLDRYFIAPGESIGLTGQDFAPGEQVLVYLNSPKGNPVMHLVADTAGQISEQDTWTPTGISGRNTLIFVGQSSKASTSVDFTIQSTSPSTAQPTTAP